MRNQILTHLQEKKWDLIQDEDDLDYYYTAVNSLFGPIEILVDFSYLDNYIFKCHAFSPINIKKHHNMYKLSQAINYINLNLYYGAFAIDEEELDIKSYHSIFFKGIDLNQHMILHTINQCAFLMQKYLPLIKELLDNKEANIKELLHEL